MIERKYNAPYNERWGLGASGSIRKVDSRGHDRSLDIRFEGVGQLFATVHDDSKRMSGDDADVPPWVEWNREERPRHLRARLIAAAPSMYRLLFDIAIDPSTPLTTRIEAGNAIYTAQHIYGGHYGAHRPYDWKPKGVGEHGEWKEWKPNA